MNLGISLKVVTRAEQKKADGTNVIYIRVTKNRQSRYLSTGLIATPADLSRDRKKIKNYQLTDQADAILRKVRGIIIAHADEFSTLNASDIIERLNAIMTVGDKFYVNFFDFARDEYRTMEFSMRRNHSVAVNAFYDFVGNPNLNVADITNKMLSDFAQALFDRGLHQNTVANYTLRVATIYRKAQSQYNDDFTTNLPRILTFKVQTKPREAVRAISIDDINTLIAYAPATARAQMARDMFLISFFLCGINFIDICTAEAPKNGVLKFRRSKIKNSGIVADMEIKIPEKLYPIINKYKDTTGQYFTNLGKIKGKPDREYIHREVCCIGEAIDKMRRKLEIKNLTFYSARHSFATIARNILKVDKGTIDECLTHVGGHRMTDVYIKRDYSAVNEVCSAIADMFDLSKYNGGRE